MDHLTETDVGFSSCYACRKCTSGCPVAEQMDIKPHEVMRLLQLGMVEELVTAGGPWQCVSCQTCFSRCPNRIDIPTILSRIRSEAIRRGALENAGTVPTFEHLLLNTIRRRGRINDSLIAVLFKLRVGGLLRDWRLGLKMFRAGKMKLALPKVQDTDSVGRLFVEDSAGGEDVK